MNRESILKDSSHWEDIEVCETNSGSYPGNLSASLKKPPLLYYKGNIEILNPKTVAIIGSRDISENGKALAFKAGEIAAKRGFVVVNGLAIGCDSEALREALRITENVLLSCLADWVKLYPDAMKIWRRGF